MAEPGGLALRPTEIGDVSAVVELYCRVAHVPMTWLRTGR